MFCTMMGVTMTTRKFVSQLTILAAAAPLARMRIGLISAWEGQSISFCGRKRDLGGTYSVEPWDCQVGRAEEGDIEEKTESRGLCSSNCASKDTGEREYH